MEKNNVIPGLTAETSSVYEDISRMNCLKNLVLFGGTAISLQCQHRLSEDLDFELVSTRRINEGFHFDEIINEVNSLFPGTRRNILGEDHFELFLPNGVKLSFFQPKDPLPSLTISYRHNNIQAPSLQELLGNKLFTLSVRTKFRDYYDIYTLLKEGCNLKEGIKYACNFSRHTLHSKNIYSLLCSSGFFRKESDFDTRLCPKYILTSEEILRYISKVIERETLTSTNINPKSSYRLR